MASGIRWSVQVSTIGLELALPALLGWWLDRKLGTEPWLLIALAILGFLVSLLHLLRLAKVLGKRSADGTDRPAPKT
ncbi:MAG: AtpZ/AtpI family protein [Planctomycetaceae bacterium]